MTDKSAAHKPRQRMPLRAGQATRVLVILALLIAGAVWLGQWFWYRQTHVVEDNATITTDLVTVSSRLPGQVQTLEIREGDELTPGQPIALLYSRPEALELASHHARVARSEAQLEFEGRQIQLAEKQLTGGIANARRQLETDQAALKVAEAEREDAEQSWQRSERLFRSGTLSAQQRDRDYYNLLSARAREEQARQQIDLRRTELANAYQGLLSGAPMTLPTPDLLRARMSITRQNLREARTELKQQQAVLEDMTIRSPSSGIVTRTFVEPGEYLAAGQPILMMHDPANLWVEAKVKETAIRKLAPGQPVAIGVDAYPDRTFKGRVMVIGRAATSQFALIPSSNPSGNFTKITQRIPVRISIDEGDLTLLSPGMMVVIAINTTQDD
ncbi:membrane fusion protein, multidrug efflux system [Marinobacter daqiaonensis]|uniref:Membrane fusion protein, multidrug efflux system n=1 Tax=Marinobacter daqiaonensis TaxID=650891 RepID=A0A1I6JTD8_9GAMM|nr:HlyD family secretion protein [Marinobacter daqiaonensis]SFR82178.1 membrane fusion protein, multidrug efflux system [Marinobacter daqiaonensis]